MPDSGRLQDKGGGAPGSPQPSWIQPMLAILAKERFYEEGWMYERKLDGERCLAFKEGESLRLYSRNKKLINGSYPELVEALEKQPVQEFVIDGEIVAFRGKSTSFELLQNRMHVLDPHRALRDGVPVYYYIFDLLRLNGYDMVKLPLLDRKRLLKKALDFKDPLRYMTHKNMAGEEYFEEACKKGWEGLIAKRAGSTYQSRRSADWLKFKCVNVQEFVIGGFTDPRRSRAGFGALLVGYYDEGKFRYAGKIGTGFTNDTLSNLYDTLLRIEQPGSPFVDFDPHAKEIHWVKPRLIAQVSFTEWTSKGKLRHPSYMGLREDKRPEEVVRENQAGPMAYGQK